MNEGDDDLDSIVAAGSTYVCVGMLNFSRPRKHGQLARPHCLVGIIAVILASLMQARGLRHSGQIVRRESLDSAIQSAVQPFMVLFSVHIWIPFYSAIARK
jgi:hypothetical protein